MFKRFYDFVKKEWGICLLYTFIILSLNSISTVYANGVSWVNILLFIIGFGAFTGFIITSSKLLHTTDIGNKFKYMLLGKDKISYDIIILLVFFSVILIPFKGLVAIMTYLPFGKNMMTSITETPYLPYVLLLIFLIVSCMYKTAIYSGLANLVYNNKEVLDSFKFGVKNISNFLPIILVLFIASILTTSLQRIDHAAITTISDTINYILPGFLILLMFCSFETNDPSKELEETSVE